MALLSSEQRLAIQTASADTPIPVFDPETNTTYYLLHSNVYERIRDLMGEPAFDIKSAYPLMNKVAHAEGWDDPEMDAYDQLDPRRQP